MVYYEVNEYGELVSKTGLPIGEFEYYNPVLDEGAIFVEPTFIGERV